MTRANRDGWERRRKGHEVREEVRGQRRKENYTTWRRKRRKRGTKKGDMINRRKTRE